LKRGRCMAVVRVGVARALSASLTQAVLLVLLFRARLSGPRHADVGAVRAGSRTPERVNQRSTNERIPNGHRTTHALEVGVKL
jgi:hypothetical protein